MDDAFAEQVEAGAAVHLSFDGFEPVLVAGDSAASVRHPRSGAGRASVFPASNRQQARADLLFLREDKGWPADLSARALVRRIFSRTRPVTQMSASPRSRSKARM